MKHILMIATGGTIASRETADGLTPQLTSEELLAEVPELEQLCRIDTVQLMNRDSTNINSRDWLRMAACVREHYAGYDGFVLTHGTDTMAYTAAALSYMVTRARTCAMPFSMPATTAPAACTSSLTTRSFSALARARCARRATTPFPASTTPRRPSCAAGRSCITSRSTSQAYSMTSEAVVTKLMWILGQTDDYAQICRMFRMPVQKDQIY